MDAKEARSLTDEILKTMVCEKYNNHIEMRIRTAAHEGKSSIRNPHVGSKEEGFHFYLNVDEAKAVRLNFESKGFEWTNHDDPDPGSPLGGAYTTLSW